MRVIAGTVRSLKLVTPEGLGTRPTTDRIKETIFNMLQNQIPDSVFVDVFAGSGGIGIEALSRGARTAYFTDNNKESIACIKQNLQHTGLESKARVYCEEGVNVFNHITEEHVDIIFMDPPYEKELEKTVLNKMKNTDSVDSSTVIIVEASLEQNMDYLNELGYELVKEKRYKTNKHIFLKKL